MYPASFEYHAPATLQEAIALLGKYGDDAKLLSGSQSLVPLTKLRLAQPAHVVDLRRVDGLIGVKQVGNELHIGGMTTHGALAASELFRAKLPMAAEAAGQIGDGQGGNLGTIGGSPPHPDPPADRAGGLAAPVALGLVRPARGGGSV